MFLGLCPKHIAILTTPLNMLDDFSLQKILKTFSSEQKFCLLKRPIFHWKTISPEMQQNLVTYNLSQRQESWES